MSYQVIALKYRPQRFGDVVGQDHVTQTLSNAIQQRRIAHAYLFVGPRGTGKTTLARIFAKCLNCSEGPRVDFAEDDPRCQEIAEGRSMDVLEIDGASNRGIEEIRELRDTVKYAPASSRYKIYIIDEVHMLTKEAFNALLKTLEEPPEHVKFMFATTEPEKVLPTILSRCQRFDLRRIPNKLIVKHLAYIAGRESVAIDEPALLAIARGADGGMRDAESTLDQLISFCGNRIEEADVLSVFGLTARESVLSLADAILTGAAETALRELDRLAGQGKDLLRLYSDLLHHFRNLLVYSVSQGDLALLEIPESEAKTLAQQTDHTTAAALSRIMETLGDFEIRLQQAAVKKIILELALLKAMEVRNAVPISEVLKALQGLQPSGARLSPATSAATSPNPPVQRRNRGAPHRPLRRPIPFPLPVQRYQTMAHPRQILRRLRLATRPLVMPPPECLPQPNLRGGKSADSVKGIVEQILVGIGRVSAFTKSYFLTAHPVSLEDRIFTIGFDPEFADSLSLVDNSKNRELIQNKLDELGYSKHRVRFVEAPAPAEFSLPTESSANSAAPAQVAPVSPVKKPRKAVATSKPEPASLDVSDFKNDPLIREALEIFKGQIIDVRK